MLSIIYIIPLLKSRKKLYYFNDLFSLVIMKNLTIEKNIKKYLKEQNIETILTGKDLLNFAVSVRKAELDKLIIESKQCKDLIRKYEIESLKKQEYNELFFISEGIQEMDYSKFDKLFLNFIPGEELYNHNKLEGPNYFEFFSSFIDVFENYCRVRTNNGSKTLKKSDITDIFADVKLYIVNEKKQLLEKLMIKEFLKECLYRKQFYQIREETQKHYIP